MLTVYYKVDLEFMASNSGINGMFHSSIKGFAIIINYLQRNTALAIRGLTDGAYKWQRSDLKHVRPLTWSQNIFPFGCFISGPKYPLLSSFEPSCDQ